MIDEEVYENLSAASKNGGVGFVKKSEQNLRARGGPHSLNFMTTGPFNFSGGASRPCSSTEPHWLLAMK